MKSKSLKQKLPLSALVVFAVVMLSGCETRWTKMADDELAEKYAECLNTDPGPAMAQVCANVERECKRRRENGVYAC